MPSTAPAAQHVVLGSGPAGTALAAELARRGHRVRLVNRRGDGPPVPGAARYAADAADPAQVRAAVAGAAAVYHCVNVAYHRQVDLLPGIQEAVLAAAEVEGVRLVVLDTLYPYGSTGGAAMAEDTPWRATGRKGRMRARLDEVYLAAHESGRVRVALGRAADFVGPGVVNSTLGGAVFPGALTGGEVLALGDIDLPHSYGYIGDVASGLATLGERPEGDGRVWHLPTAPAVSTREVHAMIEERVGRPLKVVVLDEPRAFGPFDERFMREYAELFYQHTEPQIVDSTAFERAFAVRPTPLGAALDATLAWYREALAAR
ncbi:NAD-dependent epimerase/dehydratase family protein [Marinitenerispora sediminis]|uniref:Epimerase n=1 Tax=Marinitenerispora sediminis TaxID=1931232 RepID=A0A368T4H9_9ACTN|nr:NAD-dependent epimerase/dehydratase family protein [Marinitenerispora sediminis]RCV51259.1 epimerase [Marinitenerispora sediminis]RCV55511.1 epimerase [Marinitenerispora sediminis]RCV58065.1 epimerase [Marinitenerispora sediminis]